MEQTVPEMRDNVRIATRDFVRSFSTISKRPTVRRYVVMNHGRALGIFTPVPVQQKDDEEWWKEYEDMEPLKEPKKFLTLSELRKKYSFRSGEKHLSQRIDEIVYGVKR
ncbi:MAG: hypothetical protein WCV88_06055 [Patescibacteria group bacterium]